MQRSFTLCFSVLILFAALVQSALISQEMCEIIQMFFLFCRETNLKFKMGLRVTDEKLQEERELAQFNGELLDITALKQNVCQERQHEDLFNKKMF